MKMHIYIIFLTLVSSFTWNVMATGFSKDPRNDFYNHAVAQPTLQPVFSDRRHPRSLTNAEEEKVQLEFYAFNKSFIIELKENKDLFSPNYKEIYEDNGKDVIYEPINEKERRCYYHGQILNAQGSWAAISACNGIRGAIFDGKETYLIEPNQITGDQEHFVFKLSDQKKRHFKCGVTENMFSTYEKYLDDVQTNNLRDPYKSNSDSKYIELVLINANSMYRKYGSNMTAVMDRTKTLINVANSLLSQLNVFLALQSIRVWTRSDPIEIVANHLKTLDNFLKFRKDVLYPQETHDNAVLLADMNYDGESAGLAYPGAMCKENHSGESVTDNESWYIAGLTIAHEIAHNLGSPHDDDGTKCKCVDEYCIMYPFMAPEKQTHWSTCTTNSVRKFLATDIGSCINNKPTKVYGPSCGNGYLEEGEECDCGIKEFCKDQCCDVETCRRKRGGSCS